MSYILRQLTETVHGAAKAIRGDAGARRERAAAAYRRPARWSKSSRQVSGRPACRARNAGTGPPQYRHQTSSGGHDDARAKVHRECDRDERAHASTAGKAPNGTTESGSSRTNLEICRDPDKGNFGFWLADGCRTVAFATSDRPRSASPHRTSHDACGRGAC